MVGEMAIFEIGVGKFHEILLHSSLFPPHHPHMNPAVSSGFPFRPVDIYFDWVTLGLGKLSVLLRNEP